MRDYSMLGPDGQTALDTGLAAAEWYHSDVPRAQMKALMQRENARPMRDTLLFFALMIGFAAAGIALWGTWWCVPFWLAYGVLYGSGMDARWHEHGHGTAFKTQTYNRIVYQIACFCMMRNPVTWRWSHRRHHTDTIIVGRDPEINIMRPARLVRHALNLFGLPDVWVAWQRMILNASGRLHPEEETFIPKGDQAIAIRTARIWLVIYAGVALTALATGSLIPLMVIGLPRLYGAWHHQLTGILQHAGLAENVLDHRLNTRTVYMNPVSRFIYMDMNHHIEHHMFPMVPYYNLSKLHGLIKNDLPAPTPSMWAGLREIARALRHQRSNPNWSLPRDLPPTAQAYREDYHRNAL